MPGTKKEKGITGAQLGAVMTDHCGPAEMRRSAYKYTSCGASVGFEVDGQQVYSPPQTWAELGNVTAIFVSSIVEGIEACTETLKVPVEPLATLEARYATAVEEIEHQADVLWDATHGCKDCGEENPESGYRAVNPDCRSCGGWGESI